MRTVILLILAISMAVVSCRQTDTESNILNKNVMVAENIIYDVIIKIPDEEDQWEIEKLEGYQGERMIDELFNAVYTGKMKAYDYFTDEELSPDEVREAELKPGFDRNNLGKIQFTENWYYNPENMEIEKEIISIVLGYEIREIDGTLIGYKAAFKLFLN